ncbi:copper chaperone [Deinobacterium chartae]|uniref:Copper chaperone n=1 Tax=Deinobacterium chartae TaxID=521158 RepID=A0A841HYL5_9DEIO|nr:heavy-metal-associated domain-containing protein [Deinobacterium chartae]MBB6098487.1 copper chaperone [Deinobacterium chartae]
MRTELNVTGMTCGHCRSSVEQALLAVPGVQRASVDLQAQTAVIEGRAGLEALLAAVREAGYGASPLV